MIPGYLEDLVEDQDEDIAEETDFWTSLMDNSTLFYEFNKTASVQDLEIFQALSEAYNSIGVDLKQRPKRQAGFPGVREKDSNK